jgi:hypothetical protein
MHFTEKFIAFVDVLGFKQHVTASEAGTGLPLPALLDALKGLGTGAERATMERSGFTWCPVAPCIDKHLDFRVTQISDCVIVSAEVSPAGLVNLVGHCWSAAMKLLQQGLMCRGYVTKGMIYHEDHQVVGTGYQRALEAETGVTAFRIEADERGTPFIEIDSSVESYVSTQPDECVRKMYARMVKREGGDVAIFPIQRLAHQFAVGGFGTKFDPDKEMRSNENLRAMLRSLRNKVSSFVDPANERASRKARHYLNALEEQLHVCDQTDEAIDMLARPFPARRPSSDDRV